MGCDFFKITALEVYYIASNEEIYYYHELKRDRGYIMDYYGDSDESDYSEKYSKHYNDQMISDYTPITIYSNKSWSSPQYENKYSDIVSSIKNNIPEDAFIVSIIKTQYIEPR